MTAWRNKISVETLKNISQVRREYVKMFCNALREILYLIQVAM